MSAAVSASSKIICIAFLQMLVVIQFASAQSELTEMSLEELLNLEVTSASKKAQTVNDVAGAIFVISAEDIRRSGVTSIPEALRMAPGIHVARIDDNRWAVSARGFNDQYSNKLLVMMDGRPLYTPYFAGVFWDHHTLSIDNIERIEVIRGPGATLWGSNAVNEVINIISRSARDTQGFFTQLSLGDSNNQGFNARYGNVTDNGWYYRFGFNAIDENVSDSPLDQRNNDFWRQHKSSFRLEGEPLENHEVILEGSYFDGSSRDVSKFLDLSTFTASIQSARKDIDVHGGWLSLDWSHQSESGESWQAKAYYDKVSRDYLLAELKQQTFGVDFQSRHLLGDRHDVIWGVGARALEVPFNSNVDSLSILDSNDDLSLVEIFLQDEYKLSDSTSLILGSKFEKSEYVSWETQPNIRLNHQFNPGLSFWASVSRAARTPSLGERQVAISVDYNPTEGVIPPGFTTPVVVRAIGNAGFGSEWLTAYEMGLRGKLSDSMEFDLALFDFHYDDLRNAILEDVVCEPSGLDVSQNLSCVFSSSHLAVNTLMTNDVEGSSRGAELALQWNVSDYLQINSALSWFDYDLENMVSPGIAAYDEPGWLAHVNAHWKISEKWNLDVTVRGADEVRNYGIDSYVTADMRVGWRPSPAVNVEFIAQNYLDHEHLEHGSVSNEVLPSMINRALFLRITWAP
ncbi:MAG: TonB-dependent receptor plug domain-containing protein [Pseudomonadales bacterium]|nr:TonB-dependent receptor plug domain-containing protein [Pseudomonadales bacterium]